MCRPLVVLLFAGMTVFFNSLSTVGAQNRQTAPPNERKQIGKQINFSKEIEPILRKNCYSCHGAEDQQAGLRLDDKGRALTGGDNGPAIVPGDSVKSRLIQLVEGSDQEIGRMPPEDEGAPLTKAEIALLRAWIDQGANWPESLGAQTASEHWSFEPITKSIAPRVLKERWSRGGIDRFILSRLEENGVASSAEADRVVLLRRLYLDLLGLPPSPTEVRAFLQDDRPGAYQRLVDRLLASPHFGERWGRHWLDLARYADSDGYEKDRPRPFAWRYREWVIDALNADIPFDQFSIQQIAGDMLNGKLVADASSSLAPWAASGVAAGFHRNTLHNTEGGTDPEEDRVKKTVDRTNTFGAIWLGLTVGCAQCHSHKYDPLSQREYFSLYAFFNNINEVDIVSPTSLEKKKHQQAKKVFDPRLAELKSALKNYEKERLPAAQAAWEQKVRESPVVWTPAPPSEVRSRHGAAFKTNADGSVLATGKNVGSDVYTIQLKSPLSTITAIRLEALTDQSLPKNGPGRASNGNFVLAQIQVGVSRAGESPQSIQLSAARADFSQNDWPVAAAIQVKAPNGWAVSPQIGKSHTAVFDLAEPVDNAQGVNLTITLDHKYKSNSHNLGKFRLSLTSAKRPAPLQGLLPDIVKIVQLPKEKRTKQQHTVLAKFYRQVDQEWVSLNKSVADYQKKAPSLSEMKAQSVAQTGKPRQTRIHVRGDFLRPGQPVTAHTPSVLPPIKSRGDRPDRLDLANWLTQAENPLPARVTVNRVWQRIFGRGLVVTSDDFGKQGEPPTHPGLLDDLAYEFQKNGWSLKSLIRRIVTSATYRQSSAMRADVIKRDPDNEWLARQSRRRVEAEIVRDLALAASGLLDSRIGGPSVRPPQPADHADLTYASSAKWKESQGGDRYRRAVYTFFQRTSPYPMLMTFDSPDSNECTAQRSRSNTPLQALTLWNDRAFFETAQAFGRRVMRDAPVGPNLHRDPDQTTRNRAIYAFQLCLARQPDSQEIAAVMDLFHWQQELCRGDSKAAAEIIGASAAGKGTDPCELAAWIVVGRTLMNLDEFITRE